jgi:hypothetical protein
MKPVHEPVPGEGPIGKLKSAYEGGPKMAAFIGLGYSYKKIAKVALEIKLG